jgi:GNAT superfamily N-acetyltransferase
MSALRIHPVNEHVAQLAGILRLQSANLARTLSAIEIEREGFVTAEYTFEFLSAMHEVAPSIVATDDGEVVGYALVSDPAVSRGHPLLADLCRAIEQQVWAGVALKECSYVVCGQLCVAKSHRGRGLVDKLYACFRDEYASRYELLLTDVATNNPRSLRVHRRVGFETVTTLGYGGTEWHVVLWDWRRSVDQDAAVHNNRKLVP